MPITGKQVISAVTAPCTQLGKVVPFTTYVAFLYSKIKLRTMLLISDATILEQSFLVTVMILERYRKTLFIFS